MGGNIPKFEAIVKHRSELTCGKDSMESKFEFVENCFEPYSVEVGKYFENKWSIVNITPVLGSSEYSNFLKSLGINGVISTGRHSHEIKRIKPDAILAFTGDIIKFCPNTVEYEFGSRENATRLVKFEGKLYRAILTEELNYEWYKKLPSNCKW